MDQQKDTGLQADMHQQSWAYWSLATLIVSAMLFGGGGTRFPMHEMVVMVAALPALAVGLGHMPSNLNWRAIRVPVILLFAAAGLAILQIIPLPPAIWQSLPGREELVQVAQLTGQGESWRAWSINPELTIQTSLSLIVPIAAVLCTAILNERNRRNLLYLVALLVFVNLMVAFLQAVSGGESFYLYNSTHNGLPLGLFANRNHTAQLLLVGMFLTAGLLTTSTNSAGSKTGKSMLAVGILFVMTFSIIATNSRTVGLLLLPAYVFLIVMLIPGKLTRRSIAWIIGASALLAAIFAAMMTSGKFAIVNQLVERYSASEDHRFEFWPNALEAMSVYMPFGSGLGTFDMAFRANEHLAIVGTHYVNNAHNDYLEVAIETGIFGPLLILVFLAWFLSRLIGLLLNRGRSNAKIGIFAAAALVGVLAHSLVDYPLRSLSIMTTASILLAIFAISSRGPRSEATKK